MKKPIIAKTILKPSTFDTCLSGNTYAVPIFLYKVQMGSSIHPEHVDAIHKASYNALSTWWQQSGIDVDIEKLMNYDPYLGRVTEPVQNQQ